MYANQTKFLRGNQDSFLNDSRLCEGFTDYPLDINGEPPKPSGIERCRYDFTKKSAVDFFEKTVVGAVAASKSIAGVFIDNAQSVACDGDQEVSRLNPAQRAAQMTAGHGVYKSSFAGLVDNGKYPILSTTNRYSTISEPLVPWEDQCPYGFEATAAALKGVPFARNFEFFMWQLGDTCKAHISNGILETAAGIPSIVHTPYFPQGHGCSGGCKGSKGQAVKFTEQTFLEFSMAAFLITAGKGSYFGFSNMQDPRDNDDLGGWADVSWDYYKQYDSVVTGRPLGPGTAIANSGGAAFKRSFEKGEVEVDCRFGIYKFNLNK